MTRKKNWIKLIFVTAITVIATTLLIGKGYINAYQIIQTDKDYLYNSISLSAIIGGFLFTGIGILISAVDKDIIKDVWKNNYLDNLYRASFLGLICNITTIVIALSIIVITIDERWSKILVDLQTVVIILGLVYFVWCVKELFFIIKALKLDTK